MKVTKNEREFLEITRNFRAAKGRMQYESQFYAFAHESLDCLLLYPE